MKDLKRYGADYKEKLADKKELSAKWKNTTGCGRDMWYVCVIMLVDLRACQFRHIILAIPGLQDFLP